MPQLKVKDLNAICPGCNERESAKNMVVICGVQVNKTFSRRSDTQWQPGRIALPSASRFFP